MIREKLGNVPVLFVSLKPSPSRSHLLPKMKEVNAQVNPFFLKIKKQLLQMCISKCWTKMANP